MPQYEDDSNDFIYQQNGSPPHYHHLSEATSINICFNAVSTERTQKTRRYFPDHQNRVKYGHAIFLVGICQRICLSTASTTGSV